MMDWTHIQFLTLDTQSLHELYQSYCTDDSWPALLRPQAAFDNWLLREEIRYFFGEGQVDVIADAHNNPIGYCTLVRVPEHFTPNGENAVELGTYLIPEMRGTGLNQAVKTRLKATSVSVYQATVMVHVISASNQRALRAMAHMPWLYEQVTLSMQTHPWYPYVKRRAWETQTNIILFVHSITS